MLRSHGSAGSVGSGVGVRSGEDIGGGNWTESSGKDGYTHPARELLDHCAGPHCHGLLGLFHS